jgi:osmotically-inducible protein OsmY
MKFSAIALICGASALVGCSSVCTSLNTHQNTAQANSEAEQSVKNKLAADPKTANANIDVRANTENNQITLSGTVYSEEARLEAVNDAKNAQPGAAMIDQIQVRPAEIPKSAYTSQMAQLAREQAKATGDKLGESLDDAWIYTKIESRLYVDTGAHARTVHVDVVNGMVTLRGTVNSPEAKAEAVRIAMDTGGVKKVSNELRVTAS